MLVIQVTLGPDERVFELLERLYEERNEWTVWLKVSPELRTVRNDPRFKNKVRRHRRQLYPVIAAWVGMQCEVPLLCTVTR